MTRLATGLFVASVCPCLLLAQDRDHSLERISTALQQPSSIVIGIAPAETVRPLELGIFTLVAPAGRGEIVRVSIPIGELVSRAVKGVSASLHRRQEAAARREVAAALKAFAAREE